MAVFEADCHHSVEGVDTFNACYGGTNAFFGTTNWIQGQGWNGTFGIVVCSDPAVHPDPAHISGIGASSISLSVGSRASFTLLQDRATFIKHSWDFYRPVGWHTNDAIMDVNIATGQYEEAMMWCQRQYGDSVRERNLLSRYNFLVYHNNAPYHSK